MRVVDFQASIDRRQWERARRESSRVPGGLLLLALLAALLWSLSSAPSVKLSPDRLSFSAQVGSGGVMQQAHVLNNSAVAADLASSIEGEGASDFHTDVTSCRHVEAHSECMLWIAFHPEEPGERTATLVLQQPDGVRHVILLQGSATAFPVSAQPAGLAFGAVLVGEASSFKSVIVTGPKGFHLHGGAIQNQQDSFNIGKPVCQDEPSGLQRCELPVAFAPKTTGDVETQLSLLLDTQGDPIRVTLTGTGQQTAAVPPPVLSDPAHPPTPNPPPQAQPDPNAPPIQKPAPQPTPPPAPAPVPAISVDPLLLDFSSQPQQSVEVLNDGKAPLRVSSVSLQPAASPFHIVGDACSNTDVQPACRISLQLKLPFFGRKPQYDAQLLISHNDPGKAPVAVSLHWHQPTPQPAAPAPSAQLRPSPLIFRNATPIQAPKVLVYAPPKVTQTQQLTIYNDGPVDLHDIHVRFGVFTDDGHGVFTHTNACRQLRVHQSCAETITFTPNPGARSQKIYVFEGPMGMAGSADLQVVSPPVPIG